MTEPGGLSPAKRALLERELARRRRAATVIPRRDRDVPAPLSYSQQRMWFLQQWEPGSPTFNGARALRLRGPLDQAALTAGLQTIVARHESLRTVVEGDREPVQRVLEDVKLEVHVHPMAEHAERERDLESRLRELSRQPFDLASDLMLRADLFELGADEHVLLIRMHHIAADAHSDSVLFTELSELYGAAVAGRPASLPELPIQYADFAVWQRRRLTGTLLDELVAYWRRQLDGAPELLRLPTDRPRPPVQRHEGAHHRLSLDPALVEPLMALAREQGATFFIAMLAAFSTLLYRISGEADIVLGSPIANRNNVELQGLIGFFTNTMALRTRLDGNPSFRDVVARARETALGAYAHQDLPFERVVEAVAPRRDPAYNPLFQVNFRAQASERPVLELPGIEVEPIAIDIGFSRFDLALEVELRADALSGYFEFDRDLFDEATIAELVEDLEGLLTAAGAAPELPILELALPHGRRTGARRSGRTITRRLPR